MQSYLKNNKNETGKGKWTKKNGLENEIVNGSLNENEWINEKIFYFFDYRKNIILLSTNKL